MIERSDTTPFWLKRKLIAARTVIALDRIWLKSLPLFCLIGVYVAFAFSGVWAYLNPIVHLVFLLLLGGAAFYYFVKFVRGLSLPSLEDAARSLEEHNKIKFRPIREYEATPPNADTLTEREELFWRKHIKQQRSRIKNVRLFLPQLSLGEGDRYSLRPLLVLLIFSSFFAGGVGVDGLHQAANPKVFGAAQPVEMDLWTVPPKYTGLPPRILVTSNTQNSETQPISEQVQSFKVPENSKLIGRVAADVDVEVLLKGGNEKHAFTEINPGNYQIELEGLQNGKWELIADGDPLYQMQLEITPDQIPVVDIPTVPQLTQREALYIHVAAEDDYGVAELKGEMSRDGKTYHEAVLLPFTVGSKVIASRSYHDFTAHPWAGLVVEFTVVASDEVGQTGKSKTLKLQLPEKQFNHPIARALVAERKALMDKPQENKISVAQTLGVLIGLPEAVSDDVGAMLMVSVARSMLLFAEKEEAFFEVAELLWQSALKYENGNLSIAEQRLRDAEKALMDALNRNAPDEEIRKLIDELKNAMNEYLREFAQRAPTQQDQNLAQQLQNMEQRDLMQMLDQIEKLSEAGARDQAKNLLNMLQDIMQNLQMAGVPNQQNQSSEMQALNNLDKLLSEQQRVLDETLRSSRQAIDPKFGDPGQRSQKFQELAQQQEALRQMLGEMMGELGLNGEIPQSLGNAERSMNDARNSLQGMSGRDAVAAQQQAMQHLQESLENLAQQLMQQQGQGMAVTANPQGRDPLGRMMQKGQGLSNSENDIRVLEELDVNTSRRILQELRRRLLDPNRVEFEKNYLRRLMDQF